MAVNTGLRHWNLTWHGRAWKYRKPIEIIACGGKAVEPPLRVSLPGKAAKPAGQTLLGSAFARGTHKYESPE